MTSAIEGHTVIFTADGEINAQQVRAFLEANGVPCIFRGESLRNVHGFTIDGLGKVDIFVPDDQVDRARALLAAAETGALRLADDTDVDRQQ